MRVANFGWVSSSPVLQARQLRDIGAKYAPDLVVQGFDMTDFHDDLVARERLRRMGAGGADAVSIFRAFGVGANLALGVEDYGQWLRERARWGSGDETPAVPGSRYFFLFQPPEASEPYFRPSWEAVREAEGMARAMGARYALFVFPRYQQYDPRESPRDPERRVFPTDAEGRLVPFDSSPGRRHRLPSTPARGFPGRPGVSKCRARPHWTAEGTATRRRVPSTWSRGRGARTGGGAVRVLRCFESSHVQWTVAFPCTSGS